MIKIREHLESDLPFVYNSMLKNLWADYKASLDKNEFIEGIKNPFFMTKKRELAKLFSRSQIIIAASPDDENQILGYIIFKKYDGLQILHYVYVRSTFRRFAVSKALLKHCEFEPNEPIIITYKNGNLGFITKDKTTIYKPEAKDI